MTKRRHAANGKPCLPTDHRCVGFAQRLACKRGGFKRVNLIAPRSQKQDAIAAGFTEENDRFDDLIHRAAQLIGGHLRRGGLACLKDRVRKPMRQKGGAHAF